MMRFFVGQVRENGISPLLQNAVSMPRAKIRCEGKSLTGKNHFLVVLSFFPPCFHVPEVHCSYQLSKRIFIAAQIA